MIIEKQSNTLNNIPPKTNKKKAPQSLNPDVPPLYSCYLLVGSKNAGKSYTAVKFLKNYENFPIVDDEGNHIPMRTILFSPTADSMFNPIFRALNSLDEDDIHTEYSDEILQNVLDDIELLKEEIDARNEYEKLYKKVSKFTNDEQFEKLDEEELLLLNEYNFENPKNLPKLKYKFPPANFIIFDDMIGDAKVFKKNGSDLVSKLTIKHRHKQISLIYTTQYLKAINPTIRKNIDLLSVFKYGDLKEVQDKIYSEVAGYIAPDIFMELYKHATNEIRNCLTIDIHPDTKKTHHFRKNLDTILLTEEIMDELLKKKSDTKLKDGESKKNKE